jgi:hypothetical protein
MTENIRDIESKVKRGGRHQDVMSSSLNNENIIDFDDHHHDVQDFNHPL